MIRDNYIAEPYGRVQPRTRRCTRPVVARLSAVDREPLRGWLLSLADDRVWTPVAEFVDQVRYRLALAPPAARARVVRMLADREDPGPMVRAAWAGGHRWAYPSCSTPTRHGHGCPGCSPPHPHPAGCPGCSYASIVTGDHTVRRRAAGVLLADLPNLDADDLRAGDAERADVRAVLEPLKLRISSTPVAEPLDEWIIPTWRALRSLLLDEVASLGLVAVVESSAGPAPLGEHPIDDAGLIRVHRAGDPAPDHDELARLDELHGRGDLYDEAVSAATGLEALHGVPTTLRGFCGQYSAGDVHRCEPSRHWEGWRAYSPSWCDRPRTWHAPDGTPRLTVEPYTHDGVTTLLEEVARDVVEEGLPLRLDGPPRPGIRDPGATLLVFTWERMGATLHAEYRPLIWDSYNAPPEDSPWRRRHAWEAA